MSKKVKIFSILVLCIAVAIGAFSYFGGKKKDTPTPQEVYNSTGLKSDSPLSSSTPPLGSTPSSSDAQTVVDSTFSDLLSTITNISIDTSIFSDPLYRSLRDYPILLGTDVVGRNNPFAPIGLDTGPITLVQDTSSSVDIQTLQPGKITKTSAEFGAQITLKSTVPVQIVFEYGTSEMFGNETAPKMVTKSGTSLVTVAGLSPLTPYFVRAVVISGLGVKGSTVPFTTAP